MTMMIINMISKNMDINNDYNYRLNDSDEKQMNWKISDSFVRVIGAFAADMIPIIIWCPSRMRCPPQMPFPQSRASICPCACRLARARDSHTHTHTHTQREREAEVCPRRLTQGQQLQEACGRNDSSQCWRSAGCFSTRSTQPHVGCSAAVYSMGTSMRFSCLAVCT